MVSKEVSQTITPAVTTVTGYTHTHTHTHVRFHVSPFPFRKSGCVKSVSTGSYNKTNYMHLFLKFIFGIKLYMFWTVPLFIIRSFSLYTQQWYMYDIYHCCVYSEKLLMMDRGTVRNM